MSNRTWCCLTCRKSYRRVQTVTELLCPVCHAACEYVDWKIHIPSPRRKKDWDTFWEKYRAEKALLDAFRRRELRESVRLEILNMHLQVSE